MKKLTGLTEMEKQVLTALIGMLYAEAGFSDVDANDLSRLTKIPMKVIRGVLGSLSNKEIIYIDDNGEYHIICLMSNYYGLVPNWVKELNIEPIEIA